MSGQLLPLVQLRAFEAVARLGSVRRAAAELRVGHPVISRQLRALQDWFGRRLIESSGRGTKLTEDGQALYQAIAPAMETFRRVADEMRPVARSLKIWCVAGFAAHWLAPRLIELKKLLPDYEILLRPTDMLPDFERGEADILIRYGDLSLPGTDTEILAWPRMYPVASPDYLARNPQPRSIADLAAMPLIHEASTEQWRRWLVKAGLEVPPELHGFQLWQANLAIDAAESGQGIALVNDLILPPTTNAPLVELLATDIKLDPYVLVAPQRFRRSRAIATLRNWLTATLNSSESNGA